MTAAERWRSELEAWALPEELLAAVDESPYGWSPELWRRRSRSATTHGAETPTTTILRDLLGPPPAGLLDVGAGRGRASLPLAAAGHHLVAVEQDAGMADGLLEEASGMDVTLVRGRWPEVAPRVPTADVSMCAHVVYDVQEIGPFVRALAAHARRAVVVEMTPTHPWSGLTPLYRALHGLDRPDGPTVDDFVDVVREEVGVACRLTRWEREPGIWFADPSEIEAHYGRRLLLPPERRHELGELLSIREIDGRFAVGDEMREVVTVVFDAPAAPTAKG